MMHRMAALHKTHVDDIHEELMKLECRGHTYAHNEDTIHMVLEDVLAQGQLMKPEHG